VLLACIASWLAARFILTRVIAGIHQRSKSKWDDIFLERRLFSRAANLAPAIILHLSAPVFPGIQVWIQRLASSYIVLVTLLIIFSLLDGFEEIYRTFEISKEKPIKGNLQVLKIIFLCNCFYYHCFHSGGSVSLGTPKRNWCVFSCSAADFSKLHIGLCSRYSVGGNDMVRVGDWIEMPKYNADGNVIEITLHTVKVQNWDKTITMIPSHAMVSDSFKNWRGMRESGGRRIKRAVYIDMNSIKFCTEEMLQRFEKFHYLPII
jgi:miniconductance mechanosensitive channel